MTGRHPLQNGTADDAFVRLHCPFNHESRAAVTAVGRRVRCPAVGCGVLFTATPFSEAACPAAGGGNGQRTRLLPCPACQLLLRVPVKFLGCRVACKFCEHIFRLPPSWQLPPLPELSESPSLPIAPEFKEVVAMSPASSEISAWERDRERSHAGMVRLTCPRCAKHLRIPPEWLGKKVRCPRCGGRCRFGTTHEE